MSKNEIKLDTQMQEPSFANAPTSKKIGFFSAMLVVIGSSVGAGIFFKAGDVLKYSQGSIVFAMFCWVLAGFAVICMALALIEIASARNDNLSIIGWCQTFNGRFIYKSCKNFMVYIYLPLTYFFMPLYTILSIQDGVSALVGNSYNGFGTKADWAIMMIFTILTSVYFIVVNGLSSKAGNIQNWIITSVKFLPLAFAAILGFVILGINGSVQGANYGAGFQPQNPEPGTPELFTFGKLTPGFGMFIAIGAIFFAFDGFYVTAGIQSEMKEPKKTPWAILVGLIVVTAIYLIIAISMSLGSTDGTPFGFQSFLEDKGLTWLYALFQILIGIGVLGIINGFALWSPRFVEDLMKANEIPLSTKYVKKLNDSKAKVGVMYNLALSIPIILIFCIIGGLGYVDASEYGSQYGTGVSKLYSFADLMATWTSVIAFAFILCAIIGAMKNRKTQEIKVEKSKFFLPMAYCSVLTMILPIFFTFFAPIADLFLLFKINPATSGTHQDYIDFVLVPRIMSVVVLVIFIALMTVPTLIEDHLLKKRYGSIEKGELAKIEIMARAKGIPFRDELIENINKQKRVKLNTYEQEILGVHSMNEINDNLA